MAISLKNLPFLNRGKYIVLKAYTYNPAYLDHAPIILGSKEPPIKKPEGAPETFHSCYGRVAGLSRSATVSMPSNVEFAATEGGNVSHVFADYRSTGFDINYEHAEDPAYETKDVVVSKITMPWRLEESTGVNFVSAKHILNKTHMNIPTGVLSFDVQHSVNVFNLIPKLNFTYEVKFKTPVVSLYPMSEHKLIVESYYDPAKYDALEMKNTFRPYYSGNAIKLSRAVGRLT